MSNQHDEPAPLDTDIAIVGMAGRFAGARSIDEYWNNLRDGVESLTTFTESELVAAGVSAEDLADPNYVPVGAVLPGMEDFDARFFGFSPREASIMDPQHRHFLEIAWSALENAGHMPDTFDGLIGVFGGSGHNAYMPYNLLTNPKLMQQVGFFLVRHTGNDKDFLTTRVSYLLNLRGPSVNVQTACSTSLVAIHMGVQSLLNGECDMALAGGVTIEMPHHRGYHYRENEILSPDGHCRAFDAASKGTVFGSGVGVVVLRRLADAIADGDHIHAVIKGSAVNNDGSQKVGYMAPSVDGQAHAIAEALAIANVPADSIGYVAAHGTGTPVGDPIEVAALTQAYRQSTDKTGFCALGSVKANIGHTDTAAGVASLIAVAKALQAGEIPPLLHFKSGNPACDFESTPFYLNAERIAWTPRPGVPRRAGVSSLGVGGTNAHIVLEQAPPRRPSSPPTRRFQVLAQSARSMKSLDAASVMLAEHFKAHPQIDLADAAYTLQVGRQPMPVRRVVVADSTASATQNLLATQNAATDTASEVPRSVAFLFAGGGAQYPNMGADLYRSEPVYRAVVDECLSILRSRLNLDLKPLLYPAAGAETSAAEQLQRPSLALPALFTAQLAQARLWQSWGIEPTAMIGHSMGEYTAAHLAGVFSLADALTLVELRGRLFETLPEGAMLSVPLAEADLLPLLPPCAAASSAVRRASA
jgi:acyl transferase domain-containing protein